MDVLWKTVWSRGKWWLLGLAWTTIAGAWPALVAAYDGWERYTDPTDWTLLWRLMVASCLRRK